MRLSLLLWPNAALTKPAEPLIIRTIVALPLIIPEHIVAMIDVPHKIRVRRIRYHVPRMRWIVHHIIEIIVVKTFIDSGDEILRLQRNYTNYENQNANHDS